MSITLTEYEQFKKSVDLMNALRKIPLEIIEFYLENEHGYTVRSVGEECEKPEIVRPAGPSGETR